jgi:transcriptional regulator with XRE-family HTH domain
MAMNPTTDNGQPGQEIRALREEKRWTQQDLATRLGVSRARIGQIETATGAPVSQDLLERLNDLLGVNMEISHGPRRRRARPPQDLTSSRARQHGHPGLAAASEPLDQWMENLGGTFAPMRFAIPDLDPRIMWSKVIEWATEEPTICRLTAIQGENPTWWWSKRSNTAKQYHLKTLEFAQRRHDERAFIARRVYIIARADDVLADDTVRRRFLEQVFCRGLDVGVAQRLDAAPVPGMLLVDTAEGEATASEGPGPLVVRLDGPDHELTTSEFSAIPYDVEKGRADFQRLVRRTQWVDPAGWQPPCTLLSADTMLELAELDDHEWQEQFHRAVGQQEGPLVSQLSAAIDACLLNAGRPRPHRR